MTFLLDTNVFLWFVTADPRLNPSVIQLMEQQLDECALSIVSLWEVVLKLRLGKLELPGDIFDLLAAMRLRQFDLSERHLRTLRRLDYGQISDPFDQLLVSQALTERLVLITSDSKILASRLGGLAVMDSHS